MRRTRIKGIANIPQRKKTDIIQKTEQDNQNTENGQKVLETNESELLTNNLNDTKRVVEIEEANSGSISKIQDTNKTGDINKSESHVELENIPTSRIKIIKTEVLVPRVKDIIEPFKSTESNVKELEFNKAEIIENLKDVRHINKIEQNAIIQSAKPPLVLSDNSAVSSTLKLSPNTDLGKVKSAFTNVASDLEYPAPPASPNKVNRNRIKAIPRLGYRKISFSASESEDESRRVQHRSRNDSQSSNVSALHETPLEPPATPKVKEFNSVIHRKCKRTEWSKKLADARRQFNRKFSAGAPDHKKLTMIDLIFYNPTSNPMKKEQKRTISSSFDKPSEYKLDDGSEKVDDPAEIVDDPPEKDHHPSQKTLDQPPREISDEENDIPAPQIKIGPSGEIILDDQSLVIENKQTKKDRELLQKSEVVDGNTDRPYGVFKRVRRSKDWSHNETLMFYRALSSIGTDFSLMCDLFPKRTRRELKMKFKKEERINQALIDKALMQPCNFDFEELKKEFELVEKEREYQRQKKEEMENKKETQKSVKFLNCIKEKNDAEPIKEESLPLSALPGSEKNAITLLKNRKDSKKDKSTNETKRMIKKRKHPVKLKRDNLNITSILSDSESLDDSDDYIFGNSRETTRTRYGRKVRRREIYEPNLGVDVMIPRKIVRKEPDQPPGSIMMVSKKGDDGQETFQIFMVTDKKSEGDNSGNLVPIAMIKTDKTDDEQEETEIVENNITIPADPIIIDNQNNPDAISISENNTLKEPASSSIRSIEAAVDIHPENTDEQILDIAITIPNDEQKCSETSPPRH